MPFTSGFTTKSILLAAAAEAHLFWVWLVLEIAAVGAALVVGLAFPWFAFFGRDSGKRPAEAPKTMLAGMAVLAAGCVALGLFPAPLYDLVPHAEAIRAAVPISFGDLYLHHFGHVLAKFQLLLFTALAFFLLLPRLARRETLLLDFDWFYRRGADLFYHATDTSLNSLNRWANRAIALGLSSALAGYFAEGPARLCLAVVKPFWQMTGVRIEGPDGAEARFLRTFRAAAFPVGSAAVFSVGLLLLLLLLS